MTSRTVLAALLALSLSPAVAQEATVAPGTDGACAAYPDAPASCAARAEVDDAARCALSALAMASAGEDDPVPDPSRIASDRREALRSLADGDVDSALLIASGTRAMAGAACDRRDPSTVR